MDVLLVLPTVTVLNAWYSLITDQTTKIYCQTRTIIIIMAYASSS
jgi:hypothetical protein